MLTVRLPSDIEERLEAVAKRIGRTKDEVVVEAIIEEIQDSKMGSWPSNGCKAATPSTLLSTRSGSVWA